MHAVDTNVLVRLVARDDPAQLAAAEADLAADPGWVCHVVLVETAWVLESVYGRTRAQLAAALELLAKHHRLVFESPGIVQASIGIFAASRKPSFGDCLILATAREKGHVPLATFDRALARLPGTRRLR